MLTVGEIRKGIERLRLRDPGQADIFDAWLADLEVDIGDQILPVDARVADTWGRLNAERPRPAVDTLIAATAAVHGLTVVTRNTRDFAGCGVPLVDPWQFLG